MQLSTKPQNPIIEIICALERLQEASADLGLTEDDIMALLVSGMSLGNLLRYVEDTIFHHAN